MENQNVKRFCQSCGMPLQNEADYGTEAGGARSEEYCTYCYQNGGFTADCTMDEMIDFCIRFEQQQNPGLDARTPAAPCARGTPRSSAGSRRRADAYAARRSGRAGEGTVRETPRRQGRTNSTRRLLAPRVCAKISGLHPRTHAAVHTVHRTARRGLSAQGQKLVYHICGLRICGQRGQRDGHYRTPPPAAAKRLLTNRFRFAILKNSSYAAVFTRIQALCARALEILRPWAGTATWLLL